MRKDCPKAKASVREGKKVLLVMWKMVLQRGISSMLFGPRMIPNDLFMSLSGRCFFDDL